MKGLQWPSGDKLKSCDSSGLPLISLTLNQGLLVKTWNKRKCFANQYRKVKGKGEKEKGMHRKGGKKGNEYTESTEGKGDGKEQPRNSSHLIFIKAAGQWNYGSY